MPSLIDNGIEVLIEMNTKINEYDGRVIKEKRKVKCSCGYMIGNNFNNYC